MSKVKPDPDYHDRDMCECPECQRKMHNKIVEILVNSQYQHWVEPQPERLTAEWMKKRRERAIDYYLGGSLKPLEGQTIEASRFHALVEMQAQYIMREACNIIDRLEAKLTEANKTIEGLKSKVKQLSCTHSFDDDGVCELCGLGYLAAKEYYKQALKEQKQ